MATYYDVHVFFSREDGYSIPVKIDGDEKMDDDNVIQHCVDNNLFTEDGDQYIVDSVNEIDEDEYNDMKGN